jgi:hypothetical protein
VLQVLSRGFISLGIGKHRAWVGSESTYGFLRGDSRIGRKPTLGLLWHQSPEQALEAACRLIDDGCDVYGVGTGPLTDSIDREEIARIYAMWAREKCPFQISG